MGHGKAGEADGSIGLRLRSQRSAEGGTGGTKVRETLSQAESCLILEYPLFPNVVLNVQTRVGRYFEPTQRQLREMSLLCRVKVGGGKVEDVFMNLAMQPFVWASAAALWLSYSGSPLPALVRFTYFHYLQTWDLAVHLDSALHACMTLFGSTLYQAICQLFCDIMWPEMSRGMVVVQVDAVSGTLASAHLPLVLLCSGALLAAPRPKVLQVGA